MASRFAKIMLDGMVGLCRFESRIALEESWPTRRGVVWHHEEDPEHEWAIPKQKSGEDGWVISFDSSIAAAGIEWQGVKFVSKILTAG